MLCWVGDESQIYQTGLLAMSLQSLSHKGDAFGDEDKGFDLQGRDCVSISFCHIVAKRALCSDLFFVSLICFIAGNRGL